MTLCAAIRAGDEAAVRAALAGGAAPTEIEGDSDLCALSCAVDEGRPDLVRLLLDAGAPPDEGRPLFHAVFGHHHECLRILLDAGADPNRVEGEDYTPLYTGAADPVVVAALLEHGADPNAATDVDETPLSFCASWGHLESLRLLLAAGADPNHRLRDLDWPILFFAAQEGDVAVIRALLAAGADPGFVNERGQTAAAVALDHRKTAAIRPLSIRARLRIGPTRPFAVDLDVRDVGPEPIEIVGDDPDGLQWELRRDGVVVPARWGRMDVLASPRTVRLAPGGEVTFRVSCGVPEKDLDLITVGWEVTGGEVLRCTLPDGATAMAQVPC